MLGKRHPIQIIRSLSYGTAIVVSAYVMCMILSSQNHTWIGLFCLLPLLRGIQTMTPLRSACAGGVWGLAIYIFSTATGLNVVPASALSVALLTAIPAAYTGLGAFLTRRIGFSPVFMACGWILVEAALRPLAIDSGLLASSAVGDHGVAGYVGNVFGYAWVAFFFVLASAWLLALGARFRVDIRLPLPSLGLDCPDRGPWQFYLPLVPSFVPVRTRTRAPPVR